MTRRKLAVPMVAALVGGAVTAAGMLAGSSGNSAVGRQQGLLALDSGESFSAAELYERAAPSVVSISARTVQPGAAAFQTATGGEIGVSTGSGFVLDEDGRIVTNAHVVSGVTAVQVTFPDGQMVPAEVIGKDEETDLAVLRVAPGRLDLRPLELADSQTRAAGRSRGRHRQPDRPAGDRRDRPHLRRGTADRGARRLRDRRAAGDRRGDRAGHVGRAADGSRRARGGDHLAARRGHQLRGARRRRPRRARRARGAPQGDPALARRPRPRGAGRPRGDRREHAAGRPSAPRLRAGDVVQSIDGVEVEPSPELLDEVDGRAVGDTVELQVVRRRHVLRSGAPHEMARSAWKERPATLPPRGLV